MDEGTSCVCFQIGKYNPYVKYVYNTCTNLKNALIFAVIESSIVRQSANLYVCVNLYAKICGIHIRGVTSGALLVSCLPECDDVTAIPVATHLSMKTNCAEDLLIHTRKR